jgi:hypothetical protein
MARLKTGNIAYQQSRNPLECMCSPEGFSSGQPARHDNQAQVSHRQVAGLFILAVTLWLMRAWSQKPASESMPEKV